MAYSKLSMRTSAYLARTLNYSEEKQEIIAYGLEKLIYTSLGFLAIILVGWALQATVETLCAAVAGASLRRYSGGSHCSTALRCMVTGAITYPAAAWLAHFVFVNYGPPSLLPCSILGLAIVVIIYRYSPVDSPGKPIISLEFKKRLHYTSLLVAIAFILAALILNKTSLGLAIFAGLSLQTVSLLPILNLRR